MVGAERVRTSRLPPRLIPLGVSGLIGARNVRWKRNVSVLLDRLPDREPRIELHHARPSLRHRENLRLEVIGYADDAARLELSTRMHHCLPHRFAEWSQQENLGGGSVVANAEEPSAEDAGGIEDQRVAGRNELLEITELPV